MKPAIIIPLFNHAATIRSVIDNLRAALAAAPGEELSIIVIDDGSTDGGPATLAGLERVTLLRHARNLGKGAALLTGFRHAAAHGFTHSLTIDSDGQHAPDDFVKLLAESQCHPNDLVIGQRDMRNAPLRSRKGCDAARFWLRIQTGLDIADTQCGLRSYPLDTTLTVPHRFRRYDFETEILARLAWAGIRIRGIPIACIYFPPGERVSHFRPLLDTLRGVRVNVFLVVRRLLPLPFERARFARSEETPVSFGSWWKWSTWRNAIHDALRAGSSNAELAMALALGIFIGLTPFYMLQTLLAIYFARRLHLNVLTAVLGSQISMPPLAPIWATLSYAVGRLMLTGEWVLSDLGAHSAQGSWKAFSLQGLWTFLVGNFLVAITAAVVGLFAARALLYCVRSRPVAAG